MQLNKKLDDLYNGYDTSTRSDSSFLINLYYLLKSNLLNFREDWFWAVMMVCVQPLVLLMFLGFYFKGQGSEVVLFLITGNMVLTLTTGTMLTMGQELGFLKHYKAFDYYATLPLSKISLIISFVTKTTIFSLPSMVIIFLIGYLYFGVQMTLHPTIVIVILLSGYSLAGIGAIIGIYSRNVQTASLITQIVSPLIVFLAPVLIPQNQLPAILKYTSYLMPTTYVAKAFRFAVVGQVDYWSLLIIILISILSIYLVGVKLDWRVEKK